MTSEKFVPVDPVCGIELSEELAVTHEYDGRNYFFVVTDVGKFL